MEDKGWMRRGTRHCDELLLLGFVAGLVIAEGDEYGSVVCILYRELGSGRWLGIMLYVV